MPLSMNVARLLREPLFRQSGEIFDRRMLIENANSIGPQLRLLHWRRLETLGRLPSFDTNNTEEAISGINRFGAPAVELFMVSHRWLRPSIDASCSHPDDEEATKATALIEFSKWRRGWVKRKHGFLPEIFYWIDYCCFDQKNLPKYMAMLPLWVASCERVVCFETHDYHDRAWCRLELLLSYAFNFADHQTVIGPGFSATASLDGLEETHILRQPTAGDVTDPVDVAHIQALEQLACQFKPVTIERSTGGKLQAARFGMTEVKRYRL